MKRILSIVFLLCGFSAMAQQDPAARLQYYGAIYADLLIQAGRADEGYNIAAGLYKEAPEKMVPVYMEALVATNRLQEAFPFMTTAIKEGNASDAVKAKFKDAYVKAKGSDNGYEAFRAQLEKENLDRVKADVAKRLVNEPGINFTLKDVDGKTVSLADLKGKVVVLDFWATWCGPCKASFPSMQAAVDKYRNNPDVQFLFIHTLDKASGDPAADAKKYVDDNHYSFHVLVDPRDKTTMKSKVAEAYKLEGIPAKFIIDRNGRTRFKVSGFGGSREAAVNELSAMIDYVL